MWLYTSVSEFGFGHHPLSLDSIRTRVCALQWARAGTVLWLCVMMMMDYACRCDYIRKWCWHSMFGTTPFIQMANRNRLTNSSHTHTLENGQTRRRRPRRRSYKLDVVQLWWHRLPCNHHRRHHGHCASERVSVIVSMFATLELTTSRSTTTHRLHTLNRLGISPIAPLQTRPYSILLSVIPFFDDRSSWVLGAVLVRKCIDGSVHRRRPNIVEDDVSAWSIIGHGKLTCNWLAVGNSHSRSAEWIRTKTNTNRSRQYGWCIIHPRFYTILIHLFFSCAEN